MRRLMQRAIWAVCCYKFQVVSFLGLVVSLLVCGIVYQLHGLDSGCSLWTLRWQELKGMQS